LLSANPEAPAPWVGVGPTDLEARAAHLQAAVDRQPVAAAVAAQVLRMSLAVSFEQALILESLGYSMLLASEGFKEWRSATPARARGDSAEARVSMEQSAGTLSIRLTRSAARNAVDARMRDALVDALEGALADPTGGPVVLSGEGMAFSAGGDLDEFGQADDPGRAHAIRVMQSPSRLARKLGARLTVRLHGACIGAGIEIPAAAGGILAAPGAVFRLPEVSMGLIPGAGGTASIPRRIGRHRACYMAIGGQDVDVATALAWGLVDGPAAPK
jgi:enoyl-CoA hydratase/carnithine racemase